MGTLHTCSRSLQLTVPWCEHHWGAPSAGISGHALQLTAMQPHRESEVTGAQASSSFMARSRCSPAMRPHATWLSGSTPHQPTSGGGQPWHSGVELRSCAQTPEQWRHQHPGPACCTSSAGGLFRAQSQGGGGTPGAGIVVESVEPGRIMGAAVVGVPPLGQPDGSPFQVCDDGCAGGSWPRGTCRCPPETRCAACPSTSGRPRTPSAVHSTPVQGAGWCPTDALWGRWPCGCHAPSASQPHPHQRCVASMLKGSFSTGHMAFS